MWLLVLNWWQSEAKLQLYVIHLTLKLWLQKCIYFLCGYVNTTTQTYASKNLSVEKKP
jgi:hypothetical protein